MTILIIGWVIGFLFCITVTAFTAFYKGDEKPSNVDILLMWFIMGATGGFMGYVVFLFFIYVVFIKPLYKERIN